MIDIYDNCPGVENPDQSDGDGDGIGDACDMDPDDGCEWTKVEYPIWGIAREGTAYDPFDWSEVPPDSIYSRDLERKVYELTDHLGNARVVLKDWKQSTGTVGRRPYEASIGQYSNIYPFGMEHPSRSWNGGVPYRYGYNGMETAPELGGENYTTYFRQYDSRIARWLTTDPVTHEWESPYAAMGNNPIVASDPSGADTVRCVECPEILVTAKRPEAEQGTSRLKADSYISANAKRQYYWGDEWISEDKFNKTVHTLVENYFNPSFDPSSVDYIEGVEYSSEFYNAYGEAAQRRWGSSDIRMAWINGIDNPWFSQAIEENTFEIWGLFSGLSTVGKSAVRGLLNWGASRVAARRGLQATSTAEEETAVLLIQPYKTLSKNKEISGQAHHLNQYAAYKGVIPYGEGAAIKLEGNIFKDANAPHTQVHRYLEEWWAPYRISGIRPTNLQYTKAACDALRKIGFSEKQIEIAARAMIKERLNYNLFGGLSIPNVPKAITNLAQP